MRLEDYLIEQRREKKISTAVLMTDGKKMLIIHPTGWGSVWEIPKGTMDPGENPKQTAAREFYEETGVKIRTGNLKHVGKFPLHVGKDVIMFTYMTKKLPSTGMMKSLSVFHPLKHLGDYETTAPETDDWKYVGISKYKKRVRPEMHRMIDVALETIK